MKSPNGDSSRNINNSSGGMAIKKNGTPPKYDKTKLSLLKSPKSLTSILQSDIKHTA
jgi:hypothetical protein